MGKSNKPKQMCHIPQSELDRYEKLDQEWREYKIAAPARRALVDAKLFKVSDLRKISLAELEGLHGMGKSAVARLKVLMNAKKIKFRP
ncbi:MAG: hypothetical protein ACR2IO_05235 [Candidatus Nanopelagicus sp.]|jgi:hypothetical protein